MLFIAAAIPRAFRLMKQGTLLLQRWRALDPAAQAAARAEADAVGVALLEVRRAAMARLGHGFDWTAAREVALAPPPDFRTAHAIVNLLFERGVTSMPDLVAAMGASGPDDGVLRRAIEIATADGLLERFGEDGWRVTKFYDGTLAEGDHIREIEQSIVAVVEQEGLVGAKELAKAVDADSRPPEYLAALERALFSRSVAWLGPGVFGLPRDRLAEFERAEPALADAPPQLKPAIAALATTVQNLSQALSGKPAVARAPASPPALPSAADTGGTAGPSR